MRVLPYMGRVAPPTAEVAPAVDFTGGDVFREEVLVLRMIMVPVDGSTFAEQSVPYATDLARRQGSQLDLALVHARYSSAAPELSLLREVTEWDAQQKQQEANYLHELAERVHTTSQLPVQRHLLAGDVVIALQRQARAVGADLVVMATHARTGIERAWLGSIADGLVRHLDIPILLIRPGDGQVQDAPTARYDHVLIPLDGSELAERAIDPALELAPDARITLLRVVQPPPPASASWSPHAEHVKRERFRYERTVAKDYVEWRADVLRAAGRAAAAVVAVADNEADAILEYARNDAADLVAMSTHGRNPVARMMLGSVTDRVVRNAEIPVLVC